MPKNLVIVESPSKTKPIVKYLGSNYKVLSSIGHVRDLSSHGKYGLGVNVENDFEATGSEEIFMLLPVRMKE